MNAGQQILELVNDHQFVVDFLLPESLISDIEIGQSITVSVPALDDVEFKAHVSEIGAAVKKGNAYSVTLSLEVGQHKLRNGMSATIGFELEKSQENAILLPLEAFDFDDQTQPQGKNSGAIYVVNPESMTLEKRYVVIQRKIQNKVVVLDHLKQGEWVVVAGVPYLYEGQKVSLWRGI